LPGIISPFAFPFSGAAAPPSTAPDFYKTKGFDIRADLTRSFSANGAIAGQKGVNSRLFAYLFPVFSE